MLQDPKKLCDMIKVILTKNNHDNDFYNQYIKKLKGKILTNKLYSIFDLHYPVEKLDVEDLYHLTEFLYSATVSNKEHKEKLNPAKWFSGNEIRSAKTRSINDLENSERSALRLDKILSGNGTEWTTVMSYQQIAKLYNDALLVYNFDTQRDPIIRYKDGTELKSPRLYMDSVNEIAQEMLDGNFESNTLTFNVRKTGDERIDWNPKTGVFLFEKTKDSELAIIDGFHRLSAILKVVFEKPDINGYMTVNIKNLTVSQAQHFIYQEQKRNEISEETLKVFDKTDKYMQYTKLINEYREFDNELFNKMTANSNEVGVSKFLLFSKFSNPLEEYFKDTLEQCNNARDRNRIFDYIVDFFNEVIGIQAHHYSNLKSAKNNTILLHDNIWDVYLMLAKELYQDREWKRKIEIAMQQNWDKNNPLWRELGITFANFNKNSKRKTHRYFADVINKSQKSNFNEN